jgi:hypothetical protein
MPAIDALERALHSSDRRVLARLTTPARIQAFLDDLTYSSDNFYRCPLRVLRDRTAHCFDGGMFAAAMLRRLGHPPLVLDMLPNKRDDDHLLALFKRDAHWGAIAKSNFSGLRFREPIYRSLRELVMSYFEQYFNLHGEKTLRGYTVPLNLKRFDRQGWLVRDEPLDQIADRLDEIRKVWVLAPGMERRLTRADKRLVAAGLLGVNEAGLYKPPLK